MPEVMTDLETKLAEARERLADNFIHEDVVLVREAFDDCAAIAREVVAEKDAEIARLQASRLNNSTWLLADKPRKVTDAQRGWVARILIEKWLSIAPNDDLISEICVVFDQDEPAAK
jgi:hypothetical protein